MKLRLFVVVSALVAALLLLGYVLKRPHQGIPEGAKPNPKTVRPSPFEVPTATAPLPAPQPSSKKATKVTVKQEKAAETGEDAPTAQKMWLCRQNLGVHHYIGVENNIISFDISDCGAGLGYWEKWTKTDVEFPHVPSYDWCSELTDLAKPLELGECIGYQANELEYYKTLAAQQAATTADALLLCRDNPQFLHGLVLEGYLVEFTDCGPSLGFWENATNPNVNKWVHVSNSEAVCPVLETDKKFGWKCAPIFGDEYAAYRQEVQKTAK